MDGSCLEPDSLSRIRQNDSDPDRLHSFKKRSFYEIPNYCYTGLKATSSQCNAVTIIKRLYSCFPYTLLTKQSGKLENIILMTKYTCMPELFTIL